MSRHAAAARFGVAVSSAVKWVRRHRETGSVAPAPHGGGRRSRIDPHRDGLLGRIASEPHVTLKRLSGELAARGTPVSQNAVWLWLRKNGMTHKKDLRAEEQSRADVARKRRSRQRWLGWLDPARLVFPDETWIKTNMAPLHGWGPRGRRVQGHAPHGHWRTQTFVAALRQDALTAPCVFDGPINGRAFLARVERLLVPTFRPGDVVVLDNLGSHKGAAVRRAVEAAGARLWFLPPCSPDLNPIEQAFSKVKHWLREAQARTSEDLIDRPGQITERFPPGECANYLANIGYGSKRT